MSSKFVRDAVKAFLDANWGSTTIAGEENEFDDPPEDLAPWLTYGFISSGESKLSIGSSVSCYLEEGQVIITVFVASGTGSSVALGYAESVRALMRSASFPGGLRFTTVDPPETAFPSQVNASSGNFFGYQVAAQYTYNYSA
ncbi:MAG: hypothetical protein JRJ45_00540 [Deltaproteobacteria bacterium]|nr:hypothetical protein [Deltaproteobacteria bacterium]